MNMAKYYSKITLIFIFIYFLSLSIFQASNQHWSAILDQDIIIIYNSLLIYSDNEQEYLHHPAFTTFFILGGLFKFLSFFYDNFTLKEILISEDIDQQLQNLYSFARILNSIFIFIFVFLIFKILRELNVNKSICILSTLLIISFSSIYELLFLVRSEILSVILCLLGFYFLLKYIKYKKGQLYCFFSGFFFCLALFAKIQVIFLLFFLVLIIPFLLNYFITKQVENNLINNNKYFIFSSLLFILIFIVYLIFEFFFAASILEIYVDKVISLPHYTDPFLFLIFLSFYFIFLKYLSKKQFINLREIFSIIFTIFYGLISCILFLVILDLIGLIKFHKVNIFFLTNPIHFMSWHTWQISDPTYAGEFNFLKILKKIIWLISNNYKLWPNPKFTIDIGGTLIGIQDFFRFINTIICSLLICFLVFFKKNKNILLIAFLLLVGILVLIISFDVRHSHGYNIYLYPLYLMIIAICLNQFQKKKYVVLFFVFIFSLGEFYLLRDFYRAMFARENRIYHICKIDSWKNSEGYLRKMSLNSFIPLSSSPSGVFNKYTKKMDDEFFKNYCMQLEKKVSWKANFFNIKLN